MEQLIRACYSNDIDKFKSILKSNPNLIYHKNKFGETIMYKACSSGIIELVELLISYGSDINKHDNNGHTPLSGAVYNGHYDIVKLLIENKVNVNTKDKYNMSPLDKSSMYDYMNITKLLIDNGANYNHITNKKILPYINLIKSFKLGFQSLCGIIPVKHFRKYNRVLTTILCYRKDIKAIPKVILYYILSFLFI